MKKLVAFMFVTISGLLVGSSLFAQGHILVTEFVVTPTAGEFIEIYNPTSDSVDLSHHYVTDAVSNNDNNYVTIVEGDFGVSSSSDFMVKFPDGVKIGPGQHITVAFSGTGFMTEYGVASDFEIERDDAGVTDMDSISVGGSAGLSNAGEVIILFYWDGFSDLVKDVDIVVWGDQNEAVDKTGLSIDGIDADTDASTYADDTPKAEQFIVDAENDGDENPHDSGMSAQRVLDVEDLENWGPGGNGLTGHDETSENTSWKGGIWSINEPATPGARALGDPDSLTIADVNFIRADDITAMANDDSPFLGDTLSITGIWMQGTREVGLGARWGGFLQDARGGPWSGFFIIQNDTSAGGTLITAAETGDIIRITGVMAEFPAGANLPSISQLNLITDPVTPIEFIDFSKPLPEAILLTPGDLGLTPAGNSADPQLSERWEGVLARFENLSIISNDGTLTSNTMTAGDETGTIIIDDYFSDLSDFLDTQNGIWPNFPPGTVIDVTGFVRGGTTGGFVTINPRSLADIEIAASPPAIENITRSPAAPTSAQGVEVSSVIRSVTSTIAGAQVNYQVSGGALQQVTMTNTDSLYSGTIPPQADGAFVDYFITAEDGAGLTNIVPADTSASRFFYFVRDAGATIFDLQNTPFANGNSGYINLVVTVTGIVTTDSSDFAFYWIQDGTNPWNGIRIDDTVNEVKLGDEVTVTGTVRERFNETQIFNVTNVTVNSSGNAVPGPVVVNTGNLATGSATAEQWEGTLVRVENVGVANAFADAPSNFGEFTVDDGSGEVRVDDLGNFRGNLDSTFAQGDTLISLTGILYFSFSNYKIVPRNDADVLRKPTSVSSDDQIPFTFQLAENYPNPFNPETTIRYQIAKRGNVSITIYNILGQKVKTLVDEVKPAGAYTMKWNSTNDFGTLVSSGVYFYRLQSSDFIRVRKMLLLK